MGDFNLKSGDVGYTLIIMGDFDELYEGYLIMFVGYMGELFNVKL